MAKFSRDRKPDPGTGQRIDNNSYIREPKEGLRLLATIAGGFSNAESEKIDRLADKLASACGRGHIEGFDKKLEKIRQLIQLLKNPVRQRMLSDCAIVGVGGMFSTGKSSLLNSLLENGGDGSKNGVLPVSTSPSTSVPAYILFGQTEKITACTSSGLEKPLDEKQLWALSHAFATAYKINPAQFLDFIAIERPDFPVKNIALLDTPGLDKDDTGLSKGYSDKDRTLKALRSVDHLIWLINPNSATTLDKKDITFLKELKPRGKISVIVNKAETKPEIGGAPDPDNCEALRHIRDICDTNNIACHKIFAYEAYDPDWNNGRAKLLEILNKTVASKSKTASRTEDMCELLKNLERDLQDVSDGLHVADMRAIEQMAETAITPVNLKIMVEIFGMMGLERENLKRDIRMFKNYAEEITKWATRK